MVRQTVHTAFRDIEPGLPYLEKLIVGHGHNGIYGTGDVQVYHAGGTNPLKIELCLLRNALQQLRESAGPNAHLFPLLPHRVFSPTGNDHHAIVHGSLQNIHHGQAVGRKLNGLGQLQRSYLAQVGADTVFCALGGIGVRNGNFEAFFLIEAQFLRHVIAGELRLGRPLRGKHNHVLLGLCLLGSKRKRHQCG